jgi:hypothetical protein
VRGVGLKVPEQVVRLHIPISSLVGGLLLWKRAALFDNSWGSDRGYTSASRGNVGRREWTKNLSET